MLGVAGGKGMLLKGRFAPNAGAGAKPALKVGVKLAQMVESALLGHTDDFFVCILQQGDGLQQAHLHF